MPELSLRHVHCYRGKTPTSPKGLLTKAILLTVASIVWSAVAIPIQGSFAQNDQNSTRKMRIEPNETTRKIGSAVNWESDFATAMEKSKATGKPIFWYVPTMPGTFMDRKVEIHRYMLAGPFSWPVIINLINENSIPLNAAPSAALQEQYSIKPYEFVEPGFVLLNANGTVKFSIDRVSTLHPEWFLNVLGQALSIPSGPAVYNRKLETQWDLFRRGEYPAVIQSAIQNQAPAGFSSADLAELGLLHGMALFRTGQHDAAKKIWAEVASKYPDEPLAWKASAESENIGPFMRGFETHHVLPAAALKAGVESAGSASPGDVYSKTELWNRGVEFLLGMQNENGCFYDSDYDFGGADSLPNVYVAVTSLAGMALLEARHENFQPSTQARIDDAIQRALNFVTDDAHINRADRDEILWAYAYRLRFLSRCVKDKTVKLTQSPAQLQAALQRCAESLESVQSKRGSWYHEYSNPFVTATALVALWEASTAGARISQDVVSKGTTALLADRFENGAYPYGSSRNPDGPPKAGSAKEIAAAAGRMPICEIALLVWNKSKPEDVENAIQKSLDLHSNLNMALKYDNHTSNLAYGGFFFWYDMRGRSEAISMLGESPLKTQFAKQQSDLILALPELDGCFIDSHELGRVYGTSMALMSLARLEAR